MLKKSLLFVLLLAGGMLLTETKAHAWGGVAIGVGAMSPLGMPHTAFGPYPYGGVYPYGYHPYGYGYHPYGYGYGGVYPGVGVGVGIGNPYMVRPYVGYAPGGFRPGMAHVGAFPAGAYHHW